MFNIIDHNINHNVVNICNIFFNDSNILFNHWGLFIIKLVDALGIVRTRYNNLKYTPNYLTVPRDYFKNITLLWSVFPLETFPVPIIKKGCQPRGHTRRHSEVWDKRVAEKTKSGTFSSLEFYWLKKMALLS